MSATAADQVLSSTPTSQRLPGPRGALVIGTNYRALGVVRSLGRHGIPVWVVKRGDHMLANISRYAVRCLNWTPGGEKEMVDELLKLGVKHGLREWLLWPTDDECTHLIARYYESLRQQFILTNPPWQKLQWACDKRLLYQLARDVGVNQPRTFFPHNREELVSSSFPFPVILKPTIRETGNGVPLAKAWRADDRQSLLAHYDNVSATVDPTLLMVQEIIPGAGETQLSYAALCDDGLPLAAMTARRIRQCPMDFGRFSTYVESVHEPGIIEPALKILSAIGFTGLVEVEFKHDTRDDQYKVLDINPRVWGWHTLCSRAGIDFPYLLWLVMQKQPLPKVEGRIGVRWTRMSSDVPVAILEILRGRLSVREYVRSLRGPMESAIFAADDPLPGVCELPLLAYLFGKRALGRIFHHSQQ